MAENNKTPPVGAIKIDSLPLNQTSKTTLSKVIDSNQDGFLEDSELDVDRNGVIDVLPDLYEKLPLNQFKQFQDTLRLKTPMLFWDFSDSQKPESQKVYQTLAKKLKHLIKDPKQAEALLQQSKKVFSDNPELALSTIPFLIQEWGAGNALQLLQRIGSQTLDPKVAQHRKRLIELRNLLRKQHNSRKPVSPESLRRLQSQTPTPPVQDAIATLPLVLKAGIKDVKTAQQLIIEVISLFEDPHQMQENLPTLIRLGLRSSDKIHFFLDSLRKKSGQKSLQLFRRNNLEFLTEKITLDPNNPQQIETLLNRLAFVEKILSNTRGPSLFNSLLKRLFSEIKLELSDFDPQTFITQLAKKADGYISQQSDAPKRIPLPAGLLQTILDLLDGFIRTEKSPEEKQKHLQQFSQTLSPKTLYLLVTSFQRPKDADFLSFELGELLPSQNGRDIENWLRQAVGEDYDTWAKFAKQVYPRDHNNRHIIDYGEVGADALLYLNHDGTDEYIPLNGTIDPKAAQLDKLHQWLYRLEAYPSVLEPIKKTLGIVDKQAWKTFSGDLTRLLNIIPWLKQCPSAYQKLIAGLEEKNGVQGLHRFLNELTWKDLKPAFPIEEFAKKSVVFEIPEDAHFPSSLEEIIQAKVRLKSEPPIEIPWTDPYFQILWGEWTSNVSSLAVDSPHRFTQPNGQSHHDYFLNPEILQDALKDTHQLQPPPPKIKRLDVSGEVYQITVHDQPIKVTCYFKEDIPPKEKQAILQEIGLGFQNIPKALLADIADGVPGENPIRFFLAHKELAVEKLELLIESMLERAAGVYHPLYNYIWIDPTGGDIKKTLIHEIGHAISDQNNVGHGFGMASAPGLKAFHKYYVAYMSSIFSPKELEDYDELSRRHIDAHKIYLAPETTPEQKTTKATELEKLSKLLEPYRERALKYFPSAYAVEGPRGVLDQMNNGAEELYAETFRKFIRKLNGIEETKPTKETNDTEEGDQKKAEPDPLASIFSEKDLDTSCDPLTKQMLLYYLFRTYPVNSIAELTSEEVFTKKAMQKLSGLDLNSIKLQELHRQGYPTGLELPRNFQLPITVGAQAQRWGLSPEDPKSLFGPFVKIEPSYSLALSNYYLNFSLPMAYSTGTVLNDTQADNGPYHSMQLGVGLELGIPSYNSAFFIGNETSMAYLWMPGGEFHHSVLNTLKLGAQLYQGIDGILAGSTNFDNIAQLNLGLRVNPLWLLED